MKYKIWFVTIILIVSTFSLLSFIRIDTVKATSFNGYYYGFGDSIMRATPESGGCGSIEVDGSDCYVLKMQQKYDVTNSSGHNSDGSGTTSTWGKVNWNTHITNWGWWVIESFGVNDGEISAVMDYNLSAQNKLAMYRWSYENGSNSHYSCCISILADPTNGDGKGGIWQWTPQCERINYTETLLDSYCIPYVKLYDCLDSNPFNGRRDSWTKPSVINCLYQDDVHPNANGHKRIADFLWYMISGQDKTVTYSSNSITVNCHYNETISVTKDASWNYDIVRVFCSTNSTYISWKQATDIAGNNMIQFYGQNGSNYEITASLDVHFISIDGGTNGTFIGGATPTLIWNYNNNVTWYNLQIANVSSFSPLLFNISKINIYEYPSYATIVGTTFVFTIPSSYALPEFKTYYFRLEAKHT